MKKSKGVGERRGRQKQWKGQGAPLDQAFVRLEEEEGGGKPLISTGLGPP